LEEIKKEFPLKLILLSENLGFGKANNEAAKKAKGRNLFFLNPDTYLINNAVKLLSDYLDAHENIGIVGGNLYTSNMCPNLSYGMLYPSFCSDMDGAFTELGYPLGKFIYGTDYKFNYKDIPKEVAYITGADLMIKKSLFTSVGGFDPNIFMYCEDAELAYRLVGMGYRIVNLPLAKIVHLEGKSITFKEVRKEKYYEGRRVFFTKHYSKFYILFANFAELFLLMLACFVNLCLGRKEYADRFNKQCSLFYKINF
jgi:GT2 family glycosyltransferase